MMLFSIVTAYVVVKLIFDPSMNINLSDLWLSLECVYIFGMCLKMLLVC